MKSILIVDDNPGVRKALRTFLEQRDYRVCGEAIDGMDAIYKAEEHKPDLILMDLGMPKLSGAGAATVIRKKHPNTRIIVFTLYADALGRHLAGTLGVDLMIDKTAGSAALTDALHAMLPADGRPAARQPKPRTC